MADIFKVEMCKRVGVGGFKCCCCNSYFGKSRKRLSRTARRVLKQKDKKDFYEA
jgi:hypothetical protein